MLVLAIEMATPPCTVNPRGLELSRQSIAKKLVRMFSSNRSICLFRMPMYKVRNLVFAFQTTADFWQTWKDFEVRHGNEDTMREMLRIKRSIQATYNTQVNMMSAQMLSTASDITGTGPFAFRHSISMFCTSVGHQIFFFMYLSFRLGSRYEG